jgi:hypothetical protein
MGTVNELEAAGITKDVTVGFVLSGPERLSVTGAVRLRETFFAASLAQAYRVWAPDFVVTGNVKLAGGVTLHFVDEAAGAVAVLVTM